MIKTFLTGRLGRDAVVKTLEDGKKVMHYSVAVDQGYGDNKSTLWVDCSQWSEKTGVAEYLKKGTMVAVTGEPGIRVYAKNDGQPGGSFTLRVDRVELLGSNKPEQAATIVAPQTSAQPSDITEPVDDLPF